MEGGGAKKGKRDRPLFYSSFLNLQLCVCCSSRRLLFLQREVIYSRIFWTCFWASSSRSTRGKKVTFYDNDDDELAVHVSSLELLKLTYKLSAIITRDTWQQQQQLVNQRGKKTFNKYHMTAAAAGKKTRIAIDCLLPFVLCVRLILSFFLSVRPHH